jgi:hypothetical protein
MIQKFINAAVHIVLFCEIYWYLGHKMWKKASSENFKKLKIELTDYMLCFRGPTCK